jgi:hypothetical protein
MPWSRAWYSRTMRCSRHARKVLCCAPRPLLENGNDPTSAPGIVATCIWKRSLSAPSVFSIMSATLRSATTTATAGMRRVPRPSHTVSTLIFARYSEARLQPVWRRGVACRGQACPRTTAHRPRRAHPGRRRPAPPWTAPGPVRLSLANDRGAAPVTPHGHPEGASGGAL